MFHGMVLFRVMFIHKSAHLRHEICYAVHLYVNPPISVVVWHPNFVRSYTKDLTWS